MKYFCQNIFINRHLLQSRSPFNACLSSAYRLQGYESPIAVLPAVVNYSFLQDRSRGFLRGYYIVTSVFLENAHFRRKLGLKPRPGLRRCIFLILTNNKYIDVFTA